MSVSQGYYKKGLIQTVTLSLLFFRINGDGAATNGNNGARRVVARPRVNGNGNGSSMKQIPHIANGGAGQHLQLAQSAVADDRQFEAF